MKVNEKRDKFLKYIINENQHLSEEIFSVCIKEILNEGFSYYDCKYFVKINNLCKECFKKELGI